MYFSVPGLQPAIQFCELLLGHFREVIHSQLMHSITVRLDHFKRNSAAAIARCRRPHRGGELVHGAAATALPHTRSHAAAVDLMRRPEKVKDVFFRSSRARFSWHGYTGITQNTLLSSTIVR
jgi:hypothetical protein